MRRDEAAAKAAEEAEEQHMQEVDAQRRLAILRGEEPPPLPKPEDADPRAIERHASAAQHGQAGGSRRKRKRPGEDDTEFELRLADERLGRDHSRTDTGEIRRPASSAPITDRTGHIDLLGDDRVRSRAEKNEEVDKERRKERQKLQDQYVMRLVNAAGKDGTSNPWYSNAAIDSAERPMKDVWGNDDPRRRDRDAQRMVSSDPLAVMKKGASQVRELKAERRRQQDEQDEELRQLRREQRHKDRHRRRHSRDYSLRESHRRQGSRDRHLDRHDKERKRRHRDRQDERRHRSRSRSPDHRRHRHG